MGDRKKGLANPQKDTSHFLKRKFPVSRRPADSVAQFNDSAPATGIWHQNPPPPRRRANIRENQINFPCAVKKRCVSAGVTPARQASMFQAEGIGAVSGGDLHVRFDEREVETEYGRANEAPAHERARRIGPPKPPRHFSTLLSL